MNNFICTTDFINLYRLLSVLNLTSITLQKNMREEDKEKEKQERGGRQEGRERSRAGGREREREREREEGGGKETSKVMRRRRSYGRGFLGLSGAKTIVSFECRFSSNSIQRKQIKEKETSEVEICSYL